MKQSSGRYRVPVKLNRNSPTPSLAPFTEYFQGFERVGAVRSVFGDRTDEVLSNLRIGFMPNRRMYMGIRDVDGNVAVGTYHLKNSPLRTLYLDVVHELFHINQRMTDERFFHREFMKFMQDRSLYYASPIEIPAYEHTVREAERIGMTPEEITEYLKMGPAPPKVWRSFLKEMKLKKSGSKPARRVTKFPVKIKREAPASLSPFPDYFIGFEKVPAVKELFGDSTEEVLSGVKVEFIDSPFPTIYPNEDDGHLIVASDYFRRGPVTSLYLDAFLCLNLMKGLSGGGETEDPEADFAANPAVFGAYAAMVKEARKLGLDDAKILDRLQLVRFMVTPPEYKKFLKALGLDARAAN
ncbi:MAG: hypothetical protein ABSA72_03695 [Nitrososphaerales archaeon]